MKKPKLKGVLTGTGFFSQFHIDAWLRMDEVEIMAICDLDKNKAQQLAKDYGVSDIHIYDDIKKMLMAELPDFIDIVTPPDTHYALCKIAIDHQVDIICQKPIAPTYSEAEALFDMVSKSGIRFMVHENWRFQPWYREIKNQLERGSIGHFHTVNFRMRMGDGWGEDAYLDRQPYFREMPRMLIHETGVHFIDTFRYLFGEIDSVYARLRRLNPVIAGEDAAWVQFDFRSGGLGFFDSSRYNESTAELPRFTFGECLIEGSEGSIFLYNDGRLTLKKLGEPEKPIDYAYSNTGFMGDCVFACQKHFINAILFDRPFETAPEDYRKTLQVQEAVYRSHETQTSIKI